MPYPRHLINEGETVALDLHPHWWYFSKHILTGIPLFLALIGVFTLSGSVQAVAGWAWAIFAVIWAGWLAIKFDQRIFERLIGAGDLDIESAGREGQSHFEDVRHPDGVQQEIYRQMEVNAKETASWSAPQAPAGGGANIPEQIEQLAALRDKGHITVEEFEIKKAALLDRM